MMTIDEDMGLPGPVHSHWSVEASRFVTHEHVHAGPHDHIRVGRGVVTVNTPGNYSPKEAR
jgi:hypothetical protein